MRPRTTTISLVLAATFAFSAFALQGAQEPQDAAMAIPQPKPGPEHAILRELGGEWDVKTSMTGMEPESGTQKNVLAMNDLWLLQDYTGKFMGAPFSGHGVLGYDADKKQYCGLWVDSLTTAADPIAGSYDAKTRTLTMEQTVKDPMSGQEFTMKMSTHFVDKDSYWFELTMPGPDGSPMQMLKNEYKRKK